MLITTTNTVPGKQINLLGTVHSEIIFGANLVKDFFASVTDVVGGRSRAYEKTIAEARQQALDELATAAAKINADAIVGLRMDFEIFGGKRSGMIVVTAYGTGVQY